MSEDRLNRLEALAEKILEGLAETRQRTDSNARSIEALTEDVKVYQQEARLDRARLYEAVADLYRAQANLADTQASFVSRLSSQDELIQALSRRQGEIVEILKLLTQKVNS